MRFLFLLLLISGLQNNVFALDSLRTEKVNGKFFIIHQVDPQETLFALSRRYKVSVDEITRHNPIVATGLKIGDVLRIPYEPESVNSLKKSHIVQAGETLFSISRTYNVSVSDLKEANDLISNELIIGQELAIPAVTEEDNNIQKIKFLLSDTATYHWHVVRQGETLFSLAKVYDKAVPQLKRWNRLNNDGINIGDSLIIGYTTNTKKQAGSVVDKSDPKDLKPSASKEPDPTKKDDKQPELTASVKSNKKEKEDGITREIVTNEANYDEVVETGLAELIENSGDTRKYLALHRTAKVGTIIRVHNEMNGQEVFVRVLGKLPDTSVNDKVLLKISRAAYDRLGAIDKRTRVRISYFPD